FSRVAIVPESAGGGETLAVTFSSTTKGHEWTRMKNQEEGVVVDQSQFDRDPIASDASAWLL
ncbi:MAG TPA: hypothetical protein VEA63_11825, partial [Opitutus sp.]|nr:hypothetical protein [Opitutus sp.]